MSDSVGRIPSGTVLLNGVSVPWVEWQVTNNTYFSPDSYNVTCPIAGMPAGFQRSDLSDLADIQVEIRVALNGGPETSLIIGRVDKIEDDLCEGSVRIEGRDRTADFIEAKTTEIFKNQTSSAVVQTLAARHGLTSDVTATSTKVGKYYDVDHDKLTDQNTEWELITYLAQKEGFDAWVTGTTVHFHPSSLNPNPPVLIAYTPAQNGRPASGPFTSAKMQRSLTLASDVQVTVASWNHKQKKGFKAVAKATKTKGSKSRGAPQLYTFRIPGLTQDQALQIAQQRAEAITRHERLLELTMPGDVTTTARDQIQLQGTGSSYDQLYWISEIERSENFEEGFGMTIKCKNHSPQSTVTV